MKTYEKPRLTALSLSGNDLLCTGCQVDAEEPNMDPDLKAVVDDWKLLGKNPFTDDMGCEVPIEGYCKFTSSEIVFSS